MARRPRNPPPAALAALGLAGSLGAAPPALAQEVTPPPPPAPAPEPQPAPEPPPPAPAPVPAPPPPPAPATTPATAAPSPTTPTPAPRPRSKPRPRAPAGKRARRPRPRPRPPGPQAPVATTPVAPPTTTTPAAPPPPAVQSATAPAQFSRAALAPLGDELLRSLRIPPFLLPIFQAAGTQYGIRWEVLAAINEIETDFGRNLAVSSAGAQGWMQFMPGTWAAYGTDANRDGVRDPDNPVDAIFAAARYLKASGAETDLRKAIFAYNHADWYVESVLRRAQRISALPAAVWEGLTGLAEGRFPVVAPSRIDRLQPVTRNGRLDVVRRQRRGAIVFTKPGSPVVATQDGRVVAVGRSERLGRFAILEDAHGTRWTYARLARVARTYAVPERGVKRRAPASVADVEEPVRLPAEERQAARKERLAANPSLTPVPPVGLAAAPPAERPTDGYSAYDHALLGGLKRSEVDLRRLRVGSRVIAGTVLGYAGRSTRTGRGILRLEVRPGGKAGPRIDPVPILDGLRLLQRSGMQRRFATKKRPSVGQVLLMGKDALRKRVLADPDIKIYDCGREDIQSGIIDRRVLATLEFLARSGLKPTVSSLRCGHGTYTSSGNVSHHTTGTAVDIAAINGITITPATQGPGSITDRTVRRLLELQGSMAPAQIITLDTVPGEPTTLAMGDHHDHIHVGWRPGGHGTGGMGRVEELRPGQWQKVLRRVSRIRNPRVR